MPEFETKREIQVASADDAFAKFRTVCLSLPDTEEKDHHGEPSFFVQKKMFASWSEKGGIPKIICGLEPDHVDAMVTHDPRFKRYPYDKRGIVLEAKDIRTWKEVEALVKDSYDFVLATMVKKPKAKAPAASEKTKPTAKRARKVSGRK